MALPRSARLRDGRDIQAVSRLGARARSGDLSVAVRLAAETVRDPRAVVVVGKRAGGAVVRNRLRRRVQHGLQPLLGTLPDGCDVVVRCGADVMLLSPPQLDVALGSGIRRALERAVERTAA
jgi:ribonuclease P protein component